MGVGALLFWEVISMRRQILLEAAIVVMATFIILLILGICVSCCQAPAKNTDPELEEQVNEPQVKEEAPAQAVEVQAPEAEAAEVNSGIRLEDLSKADLDYYFPAGALPIIDQYIGWQIYDPGGYENLTLWGMGFARNLTQYQPTLSIDPCMRKGCEWAWGAHCIDEILARKGSPLTGMESTSCGRHG